MSIKMPSQLSDSELVAEVARLATSERQTTADLVAHLAELDERRLHRRAGYPSLFVYCTEVLRLSEGGAYNRIEAARTARRFPQVLDLLSRGELNLGTLRLLGPCLTSENHEQLFNAASGKSKRDVEKMLAGLFPKPDVASSVRKLPARQVAADSSILRSAALIPEADASAPSNPSVPSTASARSKANDAAADHFDPVREDGTGVTFANAHSAHPHHCAPRATGPVAMPLSADRYQFRFTGSAGMHERFRRAQDLLRHAVPDGDAAEIFDRALTTLLTELERTRFAAAKRPRAAREFEGDTSGAVADARTIRAGVKRAVWARDGGRCAYVGDTGHRCAATAFLEFHHVIPYARGGPSTVANIQLRCRAHNAYEAELDFGRRELVPGRVGPGRTDRVACNAPAGVGAGSGPRECGPT